MPPAYDFKLALTRVIEPTGGPGAELATLEDAARLIGQMRPWRQARPHWDFAAELLLKAAQTRKESDIEMATADDAFDPAAVRVREKSQYSQRGVPHPCQTFAASQWAFD
jgi:hypothetical protein